VCLYVLWNLGFKLAFFTMQMGVNFALQNSSAELHASS
jgi:hypothetical protein